MPTRIEYIPYGKEWRPKTENLDPLTEWKGLRKPKMNDQILATGATVITAVCARSDESTLCIYIDSEGRLTEKTLYPSAEPLVIHRASPENDDRRGTIRIGHIAPLEPDQETVALSDPQPHLSAEAEVPAQVS